MKTNKVSPIKSNTSKQLLGTTENSNRKKKKSAFSLASAKRQIVVDVSRCNYNSIREAASERGWVLCEGAEPGVDLSTDQQRHCTHKSKKCPTVCDLVWIDACIPVTDIIRHLKPFQKINHFLGTSNITQKNRLAMNLELMRRKFPSEYSFYPKTWKLPIDMPDFRKHFNSKGKSLSGVTYILKPDKGSQGKGIILTQSVSKVDCELTQVAQVYITKPFLIDGYKFDLRLYVLILSCDPLKIYLYNDGLVRLCTTKFVPPSNGNLKNLCMHLTNYSINKNSDDFDSSINNTRGDESGSKRSLEWFKAWMISQNHDTNKLWHDVSDLCVKTIISCYHSIINEYRSAFGDVQESCCFSILGFDIVIDQSLKPWLIEVNRLPSFRCDTDVDQKVKSALIADTLSLLNLTSNNKQKYLKKVKKEAKSRLYSAKKSKKGSEDVKPFNYIKTSKHEIEPAKLDAATEDNGSYHRIYPPSGDVDTYLKLISGSESQESKGKGKKALQ